MGQMYNKCNTKTKFVEAPTFSGWVDVGTCNMIVYLALLAADGAMAHLL